MTPDPEQRLPRELLKELIEEGSDAFRGVLEKLLNYRQCIWNSDRVSGISIAWASRSRTIRRDHFPTGYKAKTLSTRVKGIASNPDSDKYAQQGWSVF